MEALDQRFWAEAEAIRDRAVAELEQGSDMLLRDVVQLLTQLLVVGDGTMGSDVQPAYRVSARDLERAHTATEALRDLGEAVEIEGDVLVYDGSGDILGAVASTDSGYQCFEFWTGKTRSGE